MPHLLFLGQKRVKIKISTLVHTYGIPDNPVARYEIYSWHKELFLFNFWCLSEDTVSKLEKSWPVFSSFDPFSSVPSLASNNKKYLHCTSMVIGNKSTALFFGFHWCKDVIKCFEVWLKIAWQCRFNYMNSLAVKAKFILNGSSHRISTFPFPTNWTRKCAKYSLYNTDKMYNPLNLTRRTYMFCNG